MKHLINSGSSLIAIATMTLILPHAARAQAAPSGAQGTPQTIALLSADDQAATAISPGPSNAAAAAAADEDIVIVGSQIRGASTSGALPVSVVSQDEIAATGAVSANELFRTIPQAGSVTFGNPTGGGQNGARGDVSTISLRGLGLGTTLVLLNGRRVVSHPTTVAVDGAPQQSFNINAIPVGGLERIEILRDGAAALYGSDAIAGVVNTVLSQNLQGASIDAQYGFAEGTHQKEGTLNASYGSDFAGGRGHFSVMGTLYARSSLLYSDQTYTATQDVRSFISDPAFASNTAFDGRQSASPWAQFQVPGSVGVIRQNGVALTSAGGIFHLQPTTNVGCQAPTAYAGVCFDDGAVTGNDDRNLRQEIWKSFPSTTITPRARRANVFLFSKYDLTDGVQLFTEASYYYAKTRAIDANATVVAAFPITVAANSYWNPFGPVGSVNRLPGLNVSAAGVPVTITSLGPVDVGPREVEVTNNQYRFLAGLRGDIGNFSWESAALYSEATVKDVSDAISNTLLQRAINRTTPDAYNVFDGGDPANPSVGDSTRNLQSTIDSFIVKGIRKNKSTLALADLKVSNAHLLSLWAGDIGFATGVEVRRETYVDDRDPHQDGTIVFTDSVTNQVLATDFAMSSPRLDVRGKRTVLSAFGELAIPIIDADMHIPLVRSIDVQVAGRYERYSDVGDIAKPKVAVSWDVALGLKLRGSWSGGFRAPNLEVLNIPAATLTGNGNIDYVQCEADLRAKRITSFAACNRTFTLSSSISGNPDVKPENSTSTSFGFVFQPEFIPDNWGRITFTVDRFELKQKNAVSSLSNANLLALDYLARVQGGATDAVIRRPVTADDIALFAGTGIAPAGQPIGLTTRYDNLQPLQVTGIDFGVSYVSPTTPFGRINASVSVSKISKYLQEALIPQQQLLDAKAAGTINNGFVIAGAQNLVGLNSRPKWRGSGTATWTLGNLQVGTFVQYIDAVRLTAILDANRNLFRVKSQTTANLYVQYAFDKGGLAGAKITVGARNIFDKNPPISSGGYLAGLYAPQARYWYTSVGYKF